MNKYKIFKILLRVLVFTVVFGMLYVPQPASAEPQIVTGSCSDRPPLEFEGNPRDLGPNDSPARVWVVYDPSIDSFCLQVWGSWLPNQPSDRSKLDMVVKLKRNGKLIQTFNPKPIVSHPVTDGVPAFVWYFHIPPCDGWNVKYHIEIEYFQIQIDSEGNWMGGSPLLDWSRTYVVRKPCLFLPFVSRQKPTPPPPTPTPPPAECPVLYLKAKYSGDGSEQLIRALQNKWGLGELVQIYQPNVLNVSLRDGDGTLVEIPSGGTFKLVREKDRWVARSLDNSDQIDCADLLFSTDVYYVELRFPWREGECKARVPVKDPLAELASLIAAQQNLAFDDVRAGLEAELLAIFEAGANEPGQAEAIFQLQYSLPPFAP
ncbi:hypothetical protein A2Z33_01815 [Candidatus Gottesmanbacteria bacterium RBG_16_52_11]|uniref:Uncharacterized protein n=1 Tax=Candidatus Gottesmanbacteria bacterium RBG_16_52_11 TaxID=1798374 RepID=A0A1F5YR08_9BACT|nr:MAG: hypothetical protein A2Z33_01815 [Candidatus Gottesmanbacteria bacterium RBG_16_52_11]